MTFGMLRNLSPAVEGRSEWLVMAERVEELAQAAAQVSRTVAGLDGIEARLSGLAAQLAKRAISIPEDVAMSNEAQVSKGAAPNRPASATESVGTKDGVEIAVSPDVTIMFEAKRCIHSRFCVLWQPMVYKANTQGDWIDPSADSAEAIVAVAHNCPSGAIRYERHDGRPNEKPPVVNLVNIRENGPLALRADILIDGRPLGYRATLCRCGASKNKPFCDGSHNAIAFTASGEPATIETQALPSRNGPLEVLPQRNGPLRVRGNLEICSGTGRTVKRTTGEALCRCGHSGNKPFCDGSHARVGFTTE
jgi:CDGSH-type Zn-finger protein/uncharacterized Fe-S cluster protein YjdI